MALPVITGVTRASIEGITSRGTPWVNVTHHRFTGGGSPVGSDLTQLAADINSAYSTTGITGTNGFLGHCKTTTTATRIKLLPLDGSSASTVVSAALSGAQTDDELPAECAPGVTLRTGLRGPRHRGRIYLPPWTEGGSNSIGQIASSDITAVETLCGKWQTLEETHNWEIVVASYKHADWNLVISFNLQPDYHVQRRRRN